MPLLAIPPKDAKCALPVLRKGSRRDFISVLFRFSRLYCEGGEKRELVITLPFLWSLADRARNGGNRSRKLSKWSK